MPKAVTFPSKSLYSEYVKLSALMVAVSIIVSMVIGLSLYYAKEKQEPLRALQEALQVDQSLSSVFDYAEQMMQFAGNKIAQMPTLDQEKIYEILSARAFTSGLDVRFSWSLLDWIDNKNMMRVNSLYGIMEPPIDMAARNHLEDSKLKPWVLQFSMPAYGIPSNEWVLPAGIGVTSAEGKFLGSVSLGFNLAVLISRLEHHMRNKNMSFAVFNSDRRLILASSGVDQEVLRQLAHKLPNLRNDHMVTLPEQLNVGRRYAFRYIKKMADYPFFILLGEDLIFERHNFYALMLPRFFELLGIALFGVSLLYGFRKKIMSPISEMSRAARDIVNEKDVELPHYELVEMNNLSEQLNQIQKIKAALRKANLATEDAHRSLHKHNLALEDKVRERTLELEKALHTKTDFLNNLSHEIRTPIHGINAISQGLVDHWPDLPEEAKAEYAKTIAVNAKRLLSLMSNLLDLSKFSAGKMQLTFVETNLLHIINEVVDECRSLYLQNKEGGNIVSIITKFPLHSNEVLVEADPDRLTQLLRNLLQNAIKFTLIGNVTIKLSEALLIVEGIAQGAWKIEVMDEGIGIPEQELEEIFTPFTQSSYTKTKAGGTGLGLSICQEIVLGHNGTIMANNLMNEAKQIVGAVFTVTIPMRQHSMASDSMVRNLVQQLNVTPR